MNGKIWQSTLVCEAETKSVGSTKVLAMQDVSEIMWMIRLIKLRHWLIWWVDIGIIIIINKVLP